MKVGDTIMCSTPRQTKTLATLLAREGVYTITETDDEGREKLRIISMEEATV